MSSYAELLDGVRTRPADRSQREVLCDALLEGGDPRGELMVLQLAGRPVPQELLERCAERVREHVPGLTRLRFEGGLVSQINLDLDHVPNIDLSWLRHEPLLRVHIEASSYGVRELEQELAKASAVLSRCRGFELRSRISEECWPVLRDFISQSEPRYLGLDLIPELLEGELPAWPSVEVAALQASPHAVAGLLHNCLTQLRYLQLGRNAKGPCLPHPHTLEHLDLREHALEPGHLQQLERWVSEGASLRYPGLELGPPGIDDPFGHSGAWWEAKPGLVARVAAIPREQMSFVTVRGAELQVHRRDDPAWRRTLDAPATAVAARVGQLVVGRADGIVEGYGLEADAPATRLAQLPGAVHDIAAHDTGLAVAFEGGWWLSRAGVVERGEDACAAVALTSTGLVRACGRELIMSDARVDLGEEIRALAADGDTLLAVAGEQVWELRGGALSLVGRRAGGGHPAVAGQGGLRIWTNLRTSVALTRDGELGVVGYPDSYSGDAELELALADVCVLDARTAVAVLEHGGANLLQPGHALKADEFPGEARRQWIFVYEGSVLTAG